MIFIRNIQFSLKNKNTNGKKEVSERGELWVWFFKGCSGWDGGVFRGFGEVTALHVKNIANGRYMFYMCFICVFKLVKHNAIWRSVLRRLIGIILNYFFNCKTLFIQTTHYLNYRKRQVCVGYPMGLFLTPVDLLMYLYILRDSKVKKQKYIGWFKLGGQQCICH